LFEPFQTTKEEGKGVGLGLAISRTIVERHHGSINVVSEVGRGTTFTMTFPAEEGTGHRGRGTEDVLATASPVPRPPSPPRRSHERFHPHRRRRAERARFATPLVSGRRIRSRHRRGGQRRAHAPGRPALRPR